MWLPILSIVADIASILAIPVLIVGYVELRGLYKEIRALRAPRGVSENAVEFLDGRVAINLVPISTLRFLPRKGDTVMLPSESGQSGAGTYEVVDVCHCYSEEIETTDYPCQARLGKVVAYVKKRGT
jgi:hypothetical protein